MATLSIESPTLTSISGLPNPSRKPEHGYRYYACELKWNSWHCRPTIESTWIPAKDALATRLIPISTWTPRFLDPLRIRASLWIPVVVKKD